MKTLYKKHNNAILVWEAYIEEHSTGANIITLSYKYGNKPRKNITSITKGKNIGKANQTTALQQAEFELLSKATKKLKEGYNEVTIPTVVEATGAIVEYLLENLKEGVDDKGNIKPQLAASYYRPSKNFTDSTGKFWKDRKYYYLKNPNVDIPLKHIAIDFPAIVQRKYNGVRALITITKDEVKITSKEGTDYIIPYIISEIYNKRDVFLDTFKTNKLVLDGELYKHDFSLESINSAVRGEVDIFTPKVDYMCYDVVDESKSFEDRYFTLHTILQNTPFIYIDLVENFHVSSNNYVQRLTDQFIEEGYEGVIVRNPRAVYSPNKRSSKVMVKLKRTIQEEYIVFNIIPQNRDESKGMFVFKSEKGDLFEVNPTFSDEQARKLLKYRQDYIHKLVTLTFYEYTEKGLPFHVIDTIFRDYE